MSGTSNIPESAAAAVMKQSEPMPENAVPVVGPNFDDNISLQQLLDSYKRIGFQANHLGRAIDIVNKMVRPRLWFLRALHTSIFFWIFYLESLATVR